MNSDGYMPGIVLAASARRASGLHAHLAAKPIDADPAPAPPEFGRIVSTVCGYIGIPQWTIYDTGRHHRTVAARQLIVFLARKLTLMSYPEIAIAMRRRGHSSFLGMKRGWETRVKNEVRVSISGGEIEPQVAEDRVVEILNERTAAA